LEDIAEGSVADVMAWNQKLADGVSAVSTNGKWPFLSLPLPNQKTAFRELRKFFRSIMRQLTKKA
jgi:hypothetical protein